MLARQQRSAQRTAHTAGKVAIRRIERALAQLLAYEGAYYYFFLGGLCMYSLLVSALADRSGTQRRRTVAGFRGLPLPS